MSVSKLNLFEKLTENYIQVPPSLEQQAVAKLALQLCQKAASRKDIKFESEPLRPCKYFFLNSKWERLIKDRSMEMCEGLLLPPALKNRLVLHIWTITLQVFSWNRTHLKFDLSPRFADSFFMPSAWSVEMILDDKKIAERLVQDERISICQRYKMACFHCLESFIPLLWDKISPEQREHLISLDKWKFLQLWSCQLSGRIEEIIPDENQFWHSLLTDGLYLGLRTIVLHCWNKLYMSLEQNSIMRTATLTASRIDSSKLLEKDDDNYVSYLNCISLLIPYIDILCFLLTQMSKEDRVVFFQRSLQDMNYNVLVCFLQWPYLDLLIPLIKELWNILPEAKYGNLLLTLTEYYSSVYNTNINDYVEYEYGVLMIKLLEETPDHFKRYVFSGNYNINTNPVKSGEMLFSVINKKPLKIRNIKIFQHIWQHVTLEEKRAFLRSVHGELFCCHLALEEKWELLNSILWECLPGNDIAGLKEKILRSDSGKKTCFQMLGQVNDYCLTSWLNWGLSSGQEIFQFILEIFFSDQKFDFKNISNFKCVIKIDCLDNAIKRYSPSENARRKFTLQFVEIYSEDVCIHFIIHSKWKEVDHFIIWGFPSEDGRNQFKKAFVKKHAMYTCECLLTRSNFQDAEHFLTWGFATEEAIQQFRKELFLTLGLKFPWASRKSQELNSLIKYFRLSPDEVVKLKREACFHASSLRIMFAHLLPYESGILKCEDFVKVILKRVTNFLRWGLTDAEAVMAFKDISDTYLQTLSFTNVEALPRIRQAWDKLMNDILCNISKRREKTC